MKSTFIRKSYNVGPAPQALLGASGWRKRELPTITTIYGIPYRADSLVPLPPGRGPVHPVQGLTDGGAAAYPVRGKRPGSCVSRVSLATGRSSPAFGSGSADHVANWRVRVLIRSSWVSQASPAGPAPASSGKLSMTAFVHDHGSLARTHDHAEAVLAHHDTPGTPAQDPRRARTSAGRVKQQAKLRCRLATTSGDATRSWVL